MMQGNTTHINSLLTTIHPREDMKFFMPIGDTRITRISQGKKYLLSLNGAKTATPNPPVVKASKIKCETVAKKNIVKIIPL